MLIKLDSTIFGQWITRQTPDDLPKWNNNDYVINQDVEKCDWWVVYHDLPKSISVNCPLENTILFTSEPESIKTYHPDYVNQFATVITCQRHLKHRNKKYNQQALPWLIGINHYGNTTLDFKDIKINYNYLKKRFKGGKIPKISTILSTKNSTPGHRQRNKFVRELKSLLGETLVVFGPNDIPLPDKYEGISPFQYHLVIENSSHHDYWTEKISDVYLGDAYPIYHGCSNMSKYFPSNSFSAISIDNPRKVANFINRIIENHYYETRLDAIHKAKVAILDKYNLFPSIQSYTHESFGSSVNQTIYPESHFTKKRSIILKKLSTTLITRTVQPFITNSRIKQETKNTLTWKVGQTSTPHHIKRNEIAKIKNRFNLNTFIETGTYHGDMVMANIPLFEHLISIELDKSLASKAKDRFRNYSKVEILQGNSKNVLSKILKHSHASILFWLDGHYSGPGTAKSDVDTPILDELRAIRRNIPNNFAIMIDDARLFNDYNGYPSLKFIKNLINFWFPNHSLDIKNDLIIISPTLL